MTCSDMVCLYVVGRNGLCVQVVYMLGLLWCIRHCF